MKSDLSDFDNVLASIWTQSQIEDRSTTRQNEYVRMLEPGLRLSATCTLDQFQARDSGLRSFPVRRPDDWSIVARVHAGSADLEWMRAGSDERDALRGIIVAPGRKEPGWLADPSVNSLTRYVDAFECEPGVALRSQTGSQTVFLEDPLLRSAVTKMERPALSSDVATVDGRYVRHYGSSIDEMGCMTAAASEYMLSSARNGVLRVLVPCDGELFVAIARLRALRVLVQRAATAVGFSNNQIQLWGLAGGQCECPDRPTHQIRLTTACVAAVLGSSDVVVAEPFPGSEGPSTDSLRLSLNTLRILRHECHLGAEDDVLGGSYYLETLTGQIVDAAWNVFLAIEDGGGLLEVSTAGTLPDILGTNTDSSDQHA